MQKLKALSDDFVHESENSRAQAVGQSFSLRSTGTDSTMASDASDHGTVDDSRFLSYIQSTSASVAGVERILRDNAKCRPGMFACGADETLEVTTAGNRLVDNFVRVFDCAPADFDESTLPFADFQDDAVRTSNPLQKAKHHFNLSCVKAVSQGSDTTSLKKRPVDDPVLESILSDLNEQTAEMNAGVNREQAAYEEIKKRFATLEQRLSALAGHVTKNHDGDESTISTMQGMFDSMMIVEKGQRVIDVTPESSLKA